MTALTAMTRDIRRTVIWRTMLERRRSVSRVKTFSILIVPRIHQKSPFVSAGIRVKSAIRVEANSQATQAAPTNTFWKVSELSVAFPTFRHF
jgi:hypothetical protein